MPKISEVPIGADADLRDTDTLLVTQPTAPGATTYRQRRYAASKVHALAPAPVDTTARNAAAAAQSTANAAIPASQKGVAGGVATLGTDGKVPAAQLSAGTGTGTSDAIDPAALPAGTALAPTDGGLIVQGGEVKTASLLAMSTAAGLSPGALPVAAALAGAHEVPVTQAGELTRCTLDTLVTYLQGRLGTTGGTGGTTGGTGGTTGGGTTTPTWTLRSTYVPSGGETAYGAVPGFYDPAGIWRVTAGNRLESLSTWNNPWVSHFLVRTGEAESVNQRLIGRFTAQADTAFHLFGRVSGVGSGVNGIACQVQGDGNFRVDPIVADARGAAAYAVGGVVPVAGTSYDLRADIVTSGGNTTVAMALFAVAAAGSALCSGTQLSAGTVAVTGAPTTQGTAGMFWYAEVENTPTFVDAFSWSAG